MWSWFPYASVPAMPAGALPLVSRLALSKAEGLHAWESLWRMGIDAGRTEGAIIASACWLGLILFAFLGGAAFRVATSFLGWVFKR
jgi:hypothetical protein